jgi:hypothetical protein
MKYKYNGTDERVFPSLGVVVKPGEEFEAPEDFVAADVVPSTSLTTKIAKPTTTSVATDLPQESE